MFKECKDENPIKFYSFPQVQVQVLFKVQRTREGQIRTVFILFHGFSVVIDSSVRDLCDLDIGPTEK